MTGRILVLAKAPVPGRVKTRLCPPCFPAEAARIAGAALADTLEASVRAAPVVLAVEGRISVPPAVRVLPQRGRSLGERIAAAFTDAGPGGPVLQIGMDTPQAGPQLLAACLARLAAGTNAGTDAGTDAVLGLAEDGGWWALGLHRPRHAQLLARVPMSTPVTGRLTLAALHGAGLRVGLLPTLRDVDGWADALAVAGLAPAGRFAAAVTGVVARLASGIGA